MPLTASLSSAASGSAMSIRGGRSLTYVVDGTFVGTWVLESSSDRFNWKQVATGTAVGNGAFIVPGDEKDSVFYRFRCSAYTSGTIIATLNEATSAASSGAGSVPSSLGGTVVATESGSVVKQTLLTLTGLSQTLPDTGQYVGTKIYDFPDGRILVLGVTATLQENTISDVATTLNASKTGAVALGTATASSTTLDSTMADLLPSTAWTSSATTGTAGTAVSAALAASAHFDGTTTAKDMYLNAAVVTGTDIDADATITWTGTVLVTWINLGDY